MRSRSGSITRLGTGRYRVRLSCGRDPATGERRVRDATVQGTRGDAEALLDRWRSERGEMPTRMTLARYLDSVWMPTIGPPRHRATTVAEYESYCRVHIKPYLGHIMLEDLKPYVLDGWLRHMTQEQVSTSTQAHAYKVLRTALLQARKWGMLQVNPLESVPRPQVRRAEPKVLDQGEAQALLERVAGTELEVPVVLALGGGLRRSEIMGLRWSDIDFTTGRVTIARSLHWRGGKEYIEATKTDKSARAVTLPAWALASLRRWRGIGACVRMRPDTVSKKFALLDTGLPFKNLRHTHATLLLAAGTDLVVVSRRLGHSTIRTTADVYLNPGASADEKAAESLAGLDTSRHADTSRHTRTSPSV